MNNTKCRNCAHFDQKHKFVQGNMVPSSFGWCAAKSTYPAKMPPGHILPTGATQVGEEEMHNPVIVYPDVLVKDCLRVIKKV